jgi:hypothetical protein
VVIDNDKIHVRDVADFLLRWPEFRSVAQNAAARVSHVDQEKKVIDWLIALADRVGEDDLQPELKDGSAPSRSRPAKGARGRAG